MAVFLSLLLTLRSCARSRVLLQLEVLALRHQLQVLQRSRPRRLRLARADRMLWVWLSRVWRVACDAGHRQARDCHRLAPLRLSCMLALEESGPAGLTVGSA